MVKNIQALFFWACERTRAGHQLDANEFTPVTLTETKETMHHRDESQPEPPSIKPDKLDHNNWTEWKEHTLTYFSHTLGVQFAPLVYVVRPDPRPVTAATLNERECKLYDFPLTGRQFNDDNKALFRVLADLMSGTTGCSWI